MLTRISDEFLEERTRYIHGRLNAYAYMRDHGKTLLDEARMRLISGKLPPEIAYRPALSFRLKTDPDDSPAARCPICAAARHAGQ